MIDEILAKPVTSLAYGWRLERRDGVTLGFTSHDRDVVVGGLLLRAAPGMEPTSIVEKMGLEEGGLDVRGALTADAFTIRDLEAGRWDGAALAVFSFDWIEPDAPVRPLASGQLGTISWSGDQFETVFSGPAARLDGPAAPFTTPTCRAAFCGPECGLNRMRFVRELTVISVNGDTANLAAGAALPVDVYAFGSVRWLEGPNCGSTSDILSNDSQSLMLVEHPRFAVDTPVRAEALEGCAKTLSNCSERFTNMVNFRGEPNLPGNDLLTRYPGAG